MKFRSAKIDHSAWQIAIKDELMAENELLKLKLELEYGMEGFAPAVDPEVQNKWLKQIYDFEEQAKEARPVRVFEFLGCPEYRKEEDLQRHEVSRELSRLLAIMESKGIALDCSADYDEAVIYRFITNELFDQKIDNISMPGMVAHFIYEEFHPNHESDLKRYVDELIQIIFRKKWDRFDSHCFADKVHFNGCDYDNEGIASIIQTFQEAHTAFSVHQFDVEDVTFDLEKQKAEVLGFIRYGARGNGNHVYGGTCKITFAFQWGFWYISGFRFPGFGE